MDPIGLIYNDIVTSLEASVASTLGCNMCFESG